ncbi:MAG: hypothetical protein AAF530_19815 [Pseudomonadota bacterium]
MTTPPSYNEASSGQYHSVTPFDGAEADESQIGKTDFAGTNDNQGHKAPPSNNQLILEAALAGKTPSGSTFAGPALDSLEVEALLSLGDQAEVREQAGKIFDEKNGSLDEAAKIYLGPMEDICHDRRVAVRRAADLVDDSPLQLEKPNKGDGTWSFGELAKAGIKAAAIGAGVVIGVTAATNFAIGTGEFPDLLNDGYSKYLFSALPALTPVAVHCIYDGLEGETSKRRFKKVLSFSTALGVSAWVLSLATLSALSGGDPLADFAALAETAVDGAPNWSDIAAKAALFTLPVSQLGTEIMGSAFIWLNLMGQARKHAPPDVVDPPETLHARESYDKRVKEQKADLDKQSALVALIKSYEESRAAFSAKVCGRHAQKALERHMREAAAAAGKVIPFEKGA